MTKTVPDEAMIDADAARILSCATGAVAAILARRAALDAAGKYDVPLAVLAGQEHSVSTHFIHHLAVLNGLKDNVTIAFASEQKHDSLTQFFIGAEKGNATPAEIARVKSHDADDTLALKADFVYGAYMAPHARSVLLNFILNEKISLRLTGAAANHEILDAKDASTARSLKNCSLFGRAAAHVKTNKIYGVHVRNHHMATSALEHANKTGARVIFQQCGNAHVLGNNKKDTRKHPPKYSLAAQFKSHGAAVLAMPIFSGFWNAADVPPQHGLTAEECLFIDGLPARRAVYDPQTDQPEVGYAADLICRADEAAYVNGVLAQMKLADHGLSVDDYQKHYTQYRGEIVKLFQDCKTPMPG